MTDLIALVNEQAEDEGLWFIDATCSEAYLQAALRKLHAAIETASPSFDITDEALNAHLRATGEWVDTYEAETESGMEIECSMTPEAADQINAEQRELLREGYAAAAARGPAAAPPTREQIARVIASKISCESDCVTNTFGCGCADDAADAVMALYSPASVTRPKLKGFFAQLTPEQQKAALEYDGPDSAPAATPPLAATTERPMSLIEELENPPRLQNGALDQDRVIDLMRVASISLSTMIGVAARACTPR